jgi:DNA polymerase IV
VRTCYQLIPVFLEATTPNSICSIVGLQLRWAAMSDSELLAKETYFQEQALLDLSDDEPYIPNESVINLERALEESKEMQPPSLSKQTSSFLGPTPRERQIQFEEYTQKRRVSDRQTNQKLTRSSTAPQAEPTENSQTTRPRNGLVTSTASGKSRLKRTISLPLTIDKECTPFYKRVGIIPRELKSGKSVKPANDIKLVPEHKQLLKDKIIYFYPNDDISMARRRRIHKAIQLGGAWVNKWSDDITHIMLDDETYTYTQLTRHLNRPIPPVCVFKSRNLSS